MTTRPRTTPRTGVALGVILALVCLVAVGCIPLVSALGPVARSSYGRHVARGGFGTGLPVRLKGSPRQPLALPAPIARLTSSAPDPTITSPRDLAVPVLMYHHVGSLPKHTSLPGLYVAPADFVAQLRALQRRGYQAVTLDQVYRFWQGQGSLPDKPVVLSFDDGNRTDVSIVAPLLHSLGWPGVLNLIVGTAPHNFARMSFAEVRTLVDAGWEIDAHTMTHPDLTQLTPAELTWQVATSRAEIRRRLGVPCDFFCYPSGRYDSNVVKAVQAAGFLGATTTDPGLSSPSGMFTLRRVRVSRGEALASFVDSVVRG